MATIQNPFIIGAKTLYEQLQNQTSKLLLLDIRKSNDYQHSHIPGAHWFDANIVNRSQEPTKGLLPDADKLADTLAKLGYQNTQRIIVYDSLNTPSAGRVAWTLYAYGINTISLLNGGYQTWSAQARPTDNHIINTQMTNFTFSGNIRSVVNYQQIINELDNPDISILDARSHAEFSGKDKRSKHGGHIPGAIHFNWQESIDSSSKLFKPIAELQQQLQTLGVRKEQTIITYCQSHQRSALLAILLMHMGYHDVKGYPGAWSDWGNRDDTPVQN